MSITPREFWRITFFHVIFYSSGAKERLTGETFLVTPSILPLQPNGKDAISDEADEKTEVHYGVEYIINRTLQTLSKVKYRFDNCGDVRHPSVIVRTEPIKKAFIDVKNRTVKTRFITEITKDNLHYCKELMQVVSEVRHLDGIKGNFAVTDTEYLSYAFSEEEVGFSSLRQLIRSISKEFVEQQQHFFDMPGIGQFQLSERLWKWNQG